MLVRVLEGLAVLRRVPVRSEKNKLYFRKGYKTYFVKGKLGWVDSRIPVTSTSSFSDFPAEFMDDDMVDALNWASDAQYKIDGDFHNFITKLLSEFIIKFTEHFIKLWPEFNHIFTIKVVMLFFLFKNPI